MKLRDVEVTRNFVVVVNRNTLWSFGEKNWFWKLISVTDGEATHKFYRQQELYVRATEISISCIPISSSHAQSLGISSFMSHT